MVSPSLIVQKSCSKSMKWQFYTSMANFYGYPLFSGAQTFLALFNGLHIPTFMTFKLDERVWKWGNTPKMLFWKEHDLLNPVCSWGVPLNFQINPDGFSDIPQKNRLQPALSRQWSVGIRMRLGLVPHRGTGSDGRDIKWYIYMYYYIYNIYNKIYIIICIYSNII